VAGKADVLVTENLKDFPASATGQFGLVVTDQDGFLLDLLDLYPAAVLAALRKQSSRYRREPRTVADLLTVLAKRGNGCAEFARTCGALWTFLRTRQGQAACDRGSTVRFEFIGHVGAEYAEGRIAGFAIRPSAAAPGQR
jgi:hypothetical protein